MISRHTGTVRNFDTRKGYGFIVSPAVTGDIFVHYKGIEGEGHRNLYAGDKVSFTLHLNGDKGLMARDVRNVHEGLTMSALFETQGESRDN